MTDIVEETEPESSFKETKLKKANKSPASVPTKVTEESDREDDFSDESEDEILKQAKNELKDFTFIPGSKEDEEQKGHTFMAKSKFEAENVDKLSSIERIRQYLESEIDKRVLEQVYPIIKSYGDDILLQDKMPELKQSLKHLISGELVDKYHQFFATYVFYQLEMEKSKPNLKSSEQNEQPSIDGSAMMNVINCFKDVSTTAKFGM